MHTHAIVAIMAIDDLIVCDRCSSCSPIAAAAADATLDYNTHVAPIFKKYCTAATTPRIKKASWCSSSYDRAAGRRRARRGDRGRARATRAG